MSEETPRGKRFITTTVEIEGREETKVVELPDFEATSWGRDADLRIVGQPVPRVDAREKVTGRARFTADVQRPGMLFAALVRATIARGRAVSIDIERARGIPGVVDVLVASDLTRSLRAGGVSLFDTTIAYPGQPLAAVCADSRYAAERAADAVAVTYEATDFAVTIERAMAGDAPAVRGKANMTRSSPWIHERGDVQAGLRAADVVVTREYRTPSALHSAMEPHGAVAEWDGDRLTIWESTQGVYRVRDEVATALGLSRSLVRVIKDYMGGGFGAKNGAGAHTLVAALFARRTGQPVRCVLDRTGEQIDTGHRPPTWQRVTLGATRDGRLTAIDAELRVALGIAGWEGGPSGIYHQMYSCPNVRTHETFVHLNTQMMQAFRAPGHVEGAFALERAMDVLGRALGHGMDPLELRLRNLAEQDEEKSRPYSSNQLRRCYEEGAARFGWMERNKISRIDARENDLGGKDSVSGLRGEAGTLNPGGGPPGTRRADVSLPARRSAGEAPRPDVARGFGMAACVWPAGGGPPAYATARLNSDGTVDVLSGTQDLGTGSRTILAQIAAESLGARLADVRVVLGDTERTPYAGNSWGSMTTASVGPAVRSAAVQAQHKLFEAAAELLECHPDDLVAHDSVIVTRDGARRLTFGEVTQRLGNVMIMGHGSRGPNPQGLGLMSFGVQFAEVEVDVATGVVRVIRIVAAHDAGRVINPLLARSQLEGGILQGLGYALFEERVLDGLTGRPLNPSLHEYKIPTFADLPSIDAFCIDNVDPSNSIGARGLAEPPIIPVAPAIANAVADALGVEIDEIPLTPWRILQIGR